MTGRAPERRQQAYLILAEGPTVPKDGIEFDVPREQMTNLPKAFLERMCRLVGASPQVSILLEGLKCSTCERCATPAVPRPSRL